LRKAEFNRDLSRFFFRQTVGISPGECLDQRALAVIDVTCGRKNEMLFGHVSFRSHEEHEELWNEPFDAVLIAQPIMFRDNLSNSIFVFFAIFVLLSVGARCAKRGDDEFILLRENCAQIEFETRVCNIADDRWI
jgi:hypothetical protein